jgi:hypothetical protein
MPQANATLIDRHPMEIHVSPSRVTARCWGVANDLNADVRVAAAYQNRTGTHEQTKPEAHEGLKDMKMFGFSGYALHA